jgi:hypothetical protein
MEVDRRPKIRRTHLPSSTDIDKITERAPYESALMKINEVRRELRRGGRGSEQSGGGANMTHW